MVPVPILGHWGEAIWGQVGASRLPFTGWQPRRRAPDADVIHFGPALPRPHLRSTTRMLGGNRVTYGAVLAEMACASSQSLHDIIGAHWRTFCRSSSGVMTERNWGTCGKTQLCVSDEWLGLLSLTCPPSSITPPSPTHRLFKQDPNAGVLFWGVVCRSQWGVSITYQWRQWFAQFSLFTSLLLFASPCPTKKRKREGTHAYFEVWGREPTWSICYKHVVSRSFSPLHLQQAELWRHALCFGLVEWIAWGGSTIVLPYLLPTPLARTRAILDVY